MRTLRQRTPGPPRRRTTHRRCWRRRRRCRRRLSTERMRGWSRVVTNSSIGIHSRRDLVRAKLEPRRHHRRRWWRRRREARHKVQVARPVGRGHGGARMRGSSQSASRCPSPRAPRAPRPPRRFATPAARRQLPLRALHARRRAASYSRTTRMRLSSITRPAAPTGASSVAAPCPREGCSHFLSTAAALGVVILEAVRRSDGSQAAQLDGASASRNCRPLPSSARCWAEAPANASASSRVPARPEPSIGQRRGR